MKGNVNGKRLFDGGDMAKLILLAVIIFANGIVNLFFFRERSVYMARYDRAKKSLEAIEVDYSEKLKKLKVARDSLTERLEVADSLLLDRKKALEEARTGLRNASRGWGNLSGAERQVWVEEALKSLMDENE